jgi:hypothetical protein
MPENNSLKSLDPTQKQKVTYCVPEWLRDEQIKINCARVKGRIQNVYDKRVDDAGNPVPVAVVCFGPSLQHTWEQVKDFKYIISCSGSHKFLVERGIIPTWHVEVDPRPHKIKLIGEPQSNTEYLIASTCHPDVLDHLKNFNVKLWHVFDATEDGQRLLPPGEWAITGGCDVGMRAMSIASFLGFRELHMFGMDHSAGTMDNPSEARHAAAHPNGGKIFSPCEFNGVTYRTTPSMLEAARQVLHELDMMPAVNATFHGEGLCQAMAKAHVRKASGKPTDNVVAMTKPELISDTYRQLNQQLHETNLAYGVGGGKHAATILKLAATLKTQSILDYGCGKGYLAKAIPFPIWEYDPAVPGKQETPRPADIVVCTDVLEHIEPEHLHFVLDDLRRCVKQVGYFVIHTGPAGKTLPDGRNTHLIQQGEEWWHKVLSNFFAVGKILQKGMELHVVVGKK